ncbi:IclR family transcriptional regulator [Conexibacter woesei]|uniref:Transcriptional regulator, IclR family n=1 Tax=Conexibacter woesei (strain DSM 14684 / CCUG 47730 / CIP 108061 / JCM 11494 / NBRC 100937 / ID131577) TaxID=469383 RepID=D3FAQ1_CONWI|nr:IclR family transcriptional regulator [Conexibacter woesei]ADB51214.1 transcriptional regulator, IclR family [Conexibacter woesei DSM 14684]
MSRGGEPHGACHLLGDRSFAGTELDAAAPPRPPAYPIASVDNALRLLLLFRDRQVLRLSEASELLGVGRSTTHRLLAMLQFHGFVVQDPDTRTYMAGPALRDARPAAAQKAGLRSRARPFLELLSGRLGSTAHLCVLEGASVVFVDSVESAKPTRIGSRIGVALPAHCTSAGKALLAQLPPEVLSTVLHGEQLVALTPSSIRSLHELEVALAETRRRGYATNFAESEADVGAVAVAVPVGPAQLRSALAVSAPAERLGPADADAVVDVLGRVARALGDRLTG